MPPPKKKNLKEPEAIKIAGNVSGLPADVRMSFAHPCAKERAHHSQMPQTCPFDVLQLTARLQFIDS